MKYSLAIAVVFTTLLCHAQYQGGTGGGGVISCSAAFQILPVELIHFTAIASGDEVRSEWATASELNNAGFHVERSPDGAHFEAIAEVRGMGTTQALTYYDAVDASPLQGLSYYRLRQTDLDGSMTFSEVVSVMMDLPQLRAFPNPVRSMLTLHGVVNSGPQQVELIDHMGRMVAEWTFAEGPVKLDMAPYPAGVYHVQLLWAGDAASWKVVKE